MTNEAELFFRRERNLELGSESKDLENMMLESLCSLCERSS